LNLQFATGIVGTPKGRENRRSAHGGETMLGQLAQQPQPDGREIRVQASDLYRIVEREAS